MGVILIILDTKIKILDYSKYLLSLFYISIFMSSANYRIIAWEFIAG